jgi:iron complex transport system ATP-binding protein
MKLLDARGISVEISGHPIIRDISLGIQAGERWGILGANGAGKTTLLHILAGLRLADSGSVSICGQAIQQLTRRQLAQRLGILFQDNEDSFPITVLETVLGGRYPHKPFWSIYNQEDMQQCMEALRLVELENMTHRIVHTLSGGERRRLAIATLIVQSPLIWLLDEPSNHLDLHYQIALLDLLDNEIERKQGGAIMVLHDVNLLTRFCTHALLIIEHDNHYSGIISDVITQESLSQLYRHPVNHIREGDKTFYYPG